MANSVTHSGILPVYGAAFNVPFAYRKSDGTSLAPTALDTEISQDHGTFADCTNEVVLDKEVGGSTDAASGYLTLTAAEMTCDAIALQSKSSNCVTALATISVYRLVAEKTGTAQAGAASTITLAAATLVANTDLNGMVVRIDSGTGAGQARRIVSAVASTQIATVDRAWETNPSSDSVYTIGYTMAHAVDYEAIAAKAQAKVAAGAVASVTGAVGSVSGNVTGSVGSVASYGTLVADLAAAVWAIATATLTGANTIGKKLAELVFGADHKALISTDAQDLSATLHVDAKTLNTAVPANAPAVSAADIATAVWGATTRTLSAFSFTVALTAGHGLALATDLATLAGKFTGITLLANWLRGLGRKDAMDSTAKTELNAGGGAYDETTDSQQAIRDTAPLGTAMRGTDGALTSLTPVTDAFTALNTLLTSTGIALTAAERTAIITALLARANTGGTAGTVGAQIEAGGAAGNPWEAVFPGTYDPATFGAHMAYLDKPLSTVGGSILLSASSPAITVDASGEVIGGDGKITVVRGTSAVVAFVCTGRTLTGHSVYCTVRRTREDATDPTDATAAFTEACTVTAPTTFSLALAPAQTDHCDLSALYWYEIRDVTADESLLIGKLQVVGSVVKRTS